MWADATSSGLPSSAAMASASAANCWRRVGSRLATSTDVSMLRMRTRYRRCSSGSDGDRLLHQLDELRIGRAADVESDARDRHEPVLGGAGDEHRIAALPRQRGRLLGRRHGGGSVADGPGDFGLRAAPTAARGP